MRRIITLALLALTLTAGTAAADRGRGRDRDHRSNRNNVVQRDHRGHTNSRPVQRDHRRDNYRHVQPRREYRDYRHVDRRAVRAHNGRYVFNGGYSRAYVRPHIHQRHYNYRVRPQILVENYDTVPGYFWVAGSWQWNGYEWSWVAGYYQVDPNYVY